jgi:diguanylate cyclase (GGDEF)-like protein
MAALMIHALVYAGGVYDVLTGSLRYGAIAPLNSWFGVIIFEGLAYAMASAIFMALLCTERETQRYRHAAHIDALTGIANHGALLKAARRLFERCRQDRAPFALIMFDLDHFKEINDLCGHRAGDDILRAFADTVRGLLRPTDFFGRYGGEEFTVVLPGAGIETARSIAERVRHAFAEAHRFCEGQTVNATVSAGVGEASAHMSFEDIIDAADQAMYQAKHLGRNRVEQAPWVRPSLAGPDNVIRVA